MITKRTIVNVIVFGGMTFLLVFIGLTKYVLGAGGAKEIGVTFSNAQGLTERDDVTMRGVPSGHIGTVTLNPDGTSKVMLEMDAGVEVPEGSIAAISRRSPIGDLVVDITPGKGEPLPNGGTIPIGDTIQPPDPERTIQVLDRVFGAIPGQDLKTLVHELALALDHRGPDLASLSVSGAKLPAKILQVKAQLESLIQEGPKVLDTLAANSSTLADDLTKTAALAAILRDRRFDLVSLSQHGAKFAEIANELLASEKPNLACLLGDFARVNSVLATPQAMRNLVDTLDLNHYFFGAVRISVAPAKHNPYRWFRVFFLTPQQPSGTEYAKHVPAPDVYGADACRSMYGNGVGPATQNPLPHLLPTSKLHPGH
jgi:virulence factor Mce-like protein